LPAKRDPARRFFYPRLRDSERAAFEAGIALATAYHYLLGLPLPRNRGELGTLLESLGRCFESQPFRERVTVRVRGLRTGRSVYRYGRIDDRVLEVRVVVRYGGCRVSARLGWLEGLKYPLMRIERIEELDGRAR